jgi:hypothetical protein
VNTSISDWGNLQSLADFMTRNILNHQQKAKIRKKKSILTHESLTKALNDRGLNVELCGTPGSMGKYEEEFSTVQTTSRLDYWLTRRRTNLSVITSLGLPSGLLQ